MQRDLDRLQRTVLRMAGLVEEAITDATRSLQSADRAGAEAVVAADARVDELENEVQEECLKILALHQPVAGDLRRVSMVLLIATDLERIGDLAVGIAERAARLAGPLPPAVPDRIAGMTDRATEMVRRSLDAFVQEDPVAARAVIRLDDAVDRDNDAIIAELIAGMRLNPDRVEADLLLFSAVRNLERIADHATNIAEDVVYLVEGEVVRHRPEALNRG